MNTTAIRILYDYHAWAHAQVWSLSAQLADKDFERTKAPVDVPICEQFIHIANTDALWMARATAQREPDVALVADFPTREDIGRLWSVVYNSLSATMESLTDDMLNDNITVNHRGEQITFPARTAFLHLFNRGTALRAQLLYNLARLGIETREQDFAYYLRDELPPRGQVEIDRDVFTPLFNYDASVTGHLVQRHLAELPEPDLDHDFGYSFSTLRHQLAHLLQSHDYWLSRAFDDRVQEEDTLFGKGAELCAALADKDLTTPIEYTTGSGAHTANLRWEMLWNLINHGADHRAQMRAFLSDLGYPVAQITLIDYVAAVSR